MVKIFDINNVYDIDDMKSDNIINSKFVRLKDYDKLRDALENVSMILTDDWDGLTPEDCRKDVKRYISKILEDKK